MPQENFNFEMKHFNSMDFGSYGIGASINPTGSQLANTNTAINWGVNNLEISLGHGMRFDQSGYLGQLGGTEREELTRLAKLNRINLSVHAPIVEPSGYSEGLFSEATRQHAYRELKTSIDFADQIGSRSGVQNVPVVVHASNDPIGNPMPNERLIYVEQETGSVKVANPLPVTLDKEGKYREYIAKLGLIPDRDYKDYDTSIVITPKGQMNMKNKLQFQQINQEIANARYWERVHEQRALDYLHQNNPTLLEEARIDAKAQSERIMHLEAEKEYYKGLEKNDNKNLRTPFVRTEDFAIKKIADTLSDLAVYSAKKESQPMIVVENWVPESVAGNPEQVRDIIAEARKQCVTKLEKEHWSSNAAAATADKVLGMNFDIGHANLWKKYTKYSEAEGRMVEYSNEDIKKWAQEVAPYIKHVHLTDNFGDVDAHLPVGWGNAPITEVVNDLKKAGWKGRAILETFGALPYGGGAFGVAESLYQTGLPMIPGGPSWESAAGAYFKSGYAFTGVPVKGGTYWPDIGYMGPHAVGFTGLPYSMGERAASGGSEFSGAPMS